MRGVSYVPIDAAKHRSSRSRVPGLRAGHSFMWSRPLPVFRRPPFAIDDGDFCRNHDAGEQLQFVLWRTEARKSSCFCGPERLAFVLLRTSSRAIADQSSCFDGPATLRPLNRFGKPT